MRDEWQRQVGQLGLKAETKAKECEELKIQLRETSMKVQDAENMKHLLKGENDSLRQTLTQLSR